MSDSRMQFAILQRLFRHEAASGIALMLAAALALILANSPFAASYDLLLSIHGSVRIGDFGINKPLLLWVNDGLMAIFFLLVGLEIKREVIGGELSDRKRAVLPAAAAIGGMIIPALTYLGLTWNTPGCSIRLGHPLRHRHRVFARRHGVAWESGAGVPQAISDRARNHR
jgi:Na+:H+ antiporter, NhaA family